MIEWKLCKVVFCRLSLSPPSLPQPHCHHRSSCLQMRAAQSALDKFNDLDIQWQLSYRIFRAFSFAGRPDQVHNCTITNISMTSMSIRCSEGFNGGLTQQFMLEVRDSQTSELRANYSSPVPRFTVNSLMPSAIYLASVYAFNTKGRSDPTVVQVAMLRMPEKQPTGEKGELGDASFSFLEAIKIFSA